MALTVAVYRIHAHHRSQVVCDAMSAGIEREGDTVLNLWEHHYTGALEADISLFYGLEGNLPAIFKKAREHRKAVYIDLGYWGRRHGGRWTGYHKVVVNDRHPTAYFQNKQHNDVRARELDIRVDPWRTNGQFILIAGMGDKGANAEGFEQEEWERWAVKKIREVTKRGIIYRPKPSWKGARPIQGVGYSDPKEKLEKILPLCHAVVTHHSNVAVDGLQIGIPAFVWKGVAAPLGSQDFEELKAPRKPEGREQWVNDISWCQWSIAEMRRGLAWRYLKEEGLL